MGDQMIAYHGKQETKDFYMARVKWHREMDYLVQGVGYEKNGDSVRACAVGCTLESYDHAQYEKELGVPEWLARVEDTIFEGLPKEKALLWPERFMASIKVGAKLETIKTPFLIYILEENLKTLDALPDMSAHPDVKNAINLTRDATKEVIRCHREGLDLSAAWSAAGSAARSAESAAWSAGSAESAAGSAAGSAARSAAWSAAESAGSAESAAWSAAWSAARSAGSAGSAAWSAAGSAGSAARSAAESAGSAAYEKYADKLIELIESCD